MNWEVGILLSGVLELAGAGSGVPMCISSQASKTSGWQLEISHEESIYIHLHDFHPNFSSTKKFSKSILFLGSEGRNLASKFIFYIKKSELVRTKTYKIPSPQGTSKAFKGIRHRQCSEGQVYKILLKLAGRMDCRSQNHLKLSGRAQRSGI